MELHLDTQGVGFLLLGVLLATLGALASIVVGVWQDGGKASVVATSRGPAVLLVAMPETDAPRAPAVVRGA